MKHICVYIVGAVVLLLLTAACSSTSNLPEGELLYRGIGKLNIEDEGTGEHAIEALEEVNAALEAAPNGALLGSSSIVTPFPLGLWIYNALLNHQGSAMNRWLFNTFGTQPVLISSVNPVLRASMASNSLQNYGYFRSQVVAQVDTLKNPLKAKVNYTVRMGQPYLLDTLFIHKFPERLQHLLDSTRQESFLKVGEPFSVIRLDAERNRVASLFRNNGYYYYRPEYVTYKADKVAKPWKVQMMMEPVAINSLSENVMKPWKIGKLTIKLRKNAYQHLRDTLQQRNMKVLFRGKRPPVRPKVLVHALNFRMGQWYSQEKQQQTESDLLNLGVFSQLQFNYIPRDTLGICDTLDVEIDATLDKPLTAELKGDVHTKTNGLTGPNVGFSLDKKNVFGGGEVLSLNANASYEWFMTHTASEKKQVNSWDIELGASLTVPRILFPGLVNLHSKRQRATMFKVSAQDVRRSSYYDLRTYGGEFTYSWSTDAFGHFAFTPLRLTYTKLGEISEEFLEKAASNEAMLLSLADQFIPVMSVTYTYDNRSLKKPVSTWWQLTLAESGNLLSLYDKLRGKSFSEKQKEIFGNPYSQFVKAIGELRKTYRISEKSQLATRVIGGAIIPYGNSGRHAPYYESFYVGGANSIRAFSVRGVGPGGYNDKGVSFVARVGELKFEANAEYRFNLLGHFNGAVFLDAGNVWSLHEEEGWVGSGFSLKYLGRDLALGTGFGVRYDMDFLVLRIDLGMPLHYPYRTEKSGYFNSPGLFKNIAWHFAIGYPF